MIRRRAPLARSTEPIARSPLKRSRERIAQRSEKALAKLPERARVIDQVWERDRGRCQACPIPGVVCGGRLDAHERIPRSAWPGGELAVDNVVLVCRNAHRWIDTHPAEAHERGLHGFSHERLRVVDG